MNLKAYKTICQKCKQASMFGSEIMCAGVGWVKIIGIKHSRCGEDIIKLYKQFEIPKACLFTLEHIMLEDLS